MKVSELMNVLFRLPKDSEVHVVDPDTGSGKPCTLISLNVNVRLTAKDGCAENINNIDPVLLPLVVTIL